MFIEAKDDGGGGDNWTTGAISRAKLQSNHHHQQTNIQLFTGRMPFLSPNQQCQTTEGKYHISWTCLPQVHLVSLTTDSSLLPWGRVAMPLISPLMPAPQGQGVPCFGQYFGGTNADVHSCSLFTISNLLVIYLHCCQDLTSHIAD